MLVVVVLACTLDTSDVMKYMYIPVYDYATDSEIQSEIDILQSSVSVIQYLLGRFYTFWVFED